jgi:ATP-dependent Zn protease
VAVYLRAGVRYEDVAGIDAVKDDIKVTMDMLLGAEEYIAIGATPPRVRHARGVRGPGLFPSGQPALVRPRCAAAPMNAAPNVPVLRAK